MNLKTVDEVLPKTRVILRMDLDVPIEKGQISDKSRLEKSIPTIKNLLAKECRIAIIGHRGRPKGREPELSLRPIYLELMMMLEPNGEGLIESVFIDEVNNETTIDLGLANNQIVFMENLRFWKGEEENDPEFLKGLVSVCQCYVDDAFAVAHRRHRSIMLFKELPAYYGLSFVEEANKIAEVTENPERPLLIILGGAKEDKLKHLEQLAEKADKILVGGKLPKILKEKEIMVSDKVLVAELREDGLDLSESDINNFVEQINVSKTIIWAGAMGFFEDSNCQTGTREIARAVAAAEAYKIIAGGDTTASVTELGLREKIDFVCSGGGVMLEFLAEGKLAAWES